MIEVKEPSIVFGLVVHAPLVTQVVLEVFLGGKVHNGEPSEDMVDGGSLTCWFVTVFV